MLFLLRNSSPCHPPHKKYVDNKDDEKAFEDVWDENWIRDATLDERQNLLFIQGVVFIPLQKCGKGRGNWTHQLTTLTLYGVISIVTFVASVEHWQSEFQTVYMSIGFGYPLIGMVSISLLDLLLYFSMMLTSPYQTTRVPAGL